MDCGPLSFSQAVIAIGVSHVVEAFAQFDESIDETFGDLKVRVGFSGAVDDQQVSS